MQSKTLYRRLPIPFRVSRQVQHLQPYRPAIRVHVSKPSSSGSYDSDGDDLLKEFQQYTDPNRLQKITKRLELTWSVDRVRVPGHYLFWSDWVSTYEKCISLWRSAAEA